MPMETALWRITPDGLIEAPRGSLSLEADLHRWIEADPKLIHRDLMLIGSEVVTDHRGRIDLLGLDTAGVVHIIELKRDKTVRDVVAQTLDYASWVKTLDSERIGDIYEHYKRGSLASAYRERFNAALPETLNEKHSMTIVASALDPSSERIVQYLSEFGLNINVVFFSVFKYGDEQMLARSWLIDPEEVQNRTEERSLRGEWTGYYFVNVGVDKEQPDDRRWEDAEKYGFVSAGDDARFRNFMQKLRVDDRIFAYIVGRGYVGYGIVRSEAVPAKNFRLSDGRPIFEAVLLGCGLRRHPDDPERAEYVVGVEWKKTYPMTQAQKYAGIFAIQQVVCRIYDPETVRFLKDKFEVDDSK
jgi:hypothetical protein